MPLLFGFAAVILGVGHPALDGRTLYHRVHDKPSAVSAAHTYLKFTTAAAAVYPTIWRQSPMISGVGWEICTCAPICCPVAF